MTDSAPSMLEHSRLKAFIPSGVGDSLCVTIRSQDGRYRGEFHYGLGRVGVGPVVLDVQTRRAEREVERYPLKQLAVLAHTGAACGGARNRLVAAGWADTNRPTVLRLLMNAEEMHRVRVVLVPGTPNPVVCPPLGETQARTFNRSCHVEIPATSGEYELRILSGLPGRPASPVRVRLRVP